VRRGGPLKRTPLRRYVALDRSSKSRAGSGTTGKGGSVVSSAGRPRVARSRFLVDAKAVIEERSGRNCEIQLPGCWGRASEKSHRITQKMGGRHRHGKQRSDRPSNALDSCHYCHGVVTLEPWTVDAKGNGWVLEEWQEPTAEPVLYRGDLVYLTDGGDVVSFEKAGA
jgi:hypothetical protein